MSAGLTPTDFILWMRGFLDGIGDTLDARQVGKIHEKLDLVQATPAAPPVSQALPAAAPVLPPSAPFVPTELPQVVRMG